MVDCGEKAFVAPIEHGAARESDATRPPGGGAGNVQPATTPSHRRSAVEATTVGAAGFEPATTRTPSVCATRLRHAPSGTDDAYHVPPGPANKASSSGF